VCYSIRKVVHYCRIVVLGHMLGSIMVDRLLPTNIKINFVCMLHLDRYS
jgi:hypothetical protein